MRTTSSACSHAGILHCVWLDYPSVHEGARATILFADLGSLSCLVHGALIVCFVENDNTCMTVQSGFRRAARTYAVGRPRLTTSFAGDTLTNWLRSKCSVYVLRRGVVVATFFTLHFGLLASSWRLLPSSHPAFCTILMDAMTDLVSLSIFIFRLKTKKATSAPDMYLLEQVFPILGRFSVTMAQPRRSTIDLTAPPDLSLSQPRTGTS